MAGAEGGWVGPAVHLLLRLGHHFPVCVSPVTSHSRSLTRHISASLHPDVNSWLLTFGFQLHNVIPGYPKPDTDAMEPSYELVHTQMKTQEWDNSKVTPHMIATPLAIPGRIETEVAPSWFLPDPWLSRPQGPSCSSSRTPQAASREFCVSHQVQSAIKNNKPLFTVQSEALGERAECRCGVF